jgi:hypothetical protein
MFKVKKLFKKIYNKIYNFFYLIYIRHVKKYFTLSSKPLISGDSFKKIANHKFDEVNKFNPLQVNKSEIIFVKTDYLNIFINDYLHKLPDEITVITHNSDINIFGDEIKKFEEKRIQWFAQNLNINQTTSKYIHFLPLGFENRNWFKNGKLNTLLNREIPVNKINKIFIGFNINTNPDRVNSLSALQNNQNIFIFRRSSHKEYMSELSSYKLSLCPPGNGIDTHRIWESLLVKTLPIVKKSNFTDNLESMSVPLIALKDWEEISNISSDDINKLYQQHIDKLENIEILKLKFWVDKFKEQNKNFKIND